MEVVNTANLGEVDAVDLQRVAAQIAVRDPNIVVPRYQDFLACEIIKQGQTLCKMVASADIARQDYHIRRLLAQKLEH